MRILLTGANGLIGSAVRAKLTMSGQEVVAVVRRRPRGAEVGIDIAAATTPEHWLPHLAAVDAVVNCAGVLHDGFGDSARGVHVAGVSALFAACEEAGVRRVVHVSALGADRGLTPFTRTKLAGEEDLRARDLDWVVLRPSVVVGRAAYGGSALFRALAALPVLPEVRAAGKLQIVQLDDLVDAIAFFIQTEAPARLTLDLVGPEQQTVTEVVQTYRRWLHRPPAQTLPVPIWLWRTMCWKGDLVRLFGWRSPLNSTLGREVLAGSAGDGAEFARVTGIEPRSLSAALSAEPASVQEQWFARLYLLKPIVLGSLALFWVLTGVISLWPGYEMARAYLLPSLGELAVPTVLAGAIADILIGTGILFRRTARLALVGALLLSIVYLAGATVLIPELWFDPLGPLLKVLPVVLLSIVALAILTDR